jgi:hypothetical protein
MTSAAARAYRRRSYTTGIHKLPTLNQPARLLFDPK